MLRPPTAPTTTLLTQPRLGRGRAAAGCSGATLFPQTLHKPQSLVASGVTSGVKKQRLGPPLPQTGESGGQLLRGSLQPAGLQGRHTRSPVLPAPIPAGCYLGKSPHLPGLGPRLGNGRNGGREPGLCQPESLFLPFLSPSPGEAISLRQQGLGFPTLHNKQKSALWAGVWLQGAGQGLPRRAPRIHKAGSAAGTSCQR